MTYTTLTYAGTEKALADWGISSWSRTQQNQGADDFTLTIQTPMDGTEIFPYGANIIIKINRAGSRTNPNNPTLPASIDDGGGALTFSGGTQWFWGYCIDNDRTGEPGNEAFVYKFVGPYQFFFDRLVFQKLQFVWNGRAMFTDWQSDVILGLSLTWMTGPSDEIPDTAGTDLMTIAQQIKEICMYAQNDSAWQQANNGLSWPTSSVSGQPSNAQFQCDQLTNEVDGVNYDLLATPSANCLIDDYCVGPVSGKTSASTLPSSSYMLRAPLDTVNNITCAEAMRRQLQWLGGVGSPVVWTDHSQTPPQLHIATRDQLNAVVLPLSGITVKNKIKLRNDLIPPAVHFRYKVAGSILNQPYSFIINDCAAYLGSDLVEGIGEIDGLGGFNSITGGLALSSGAQNSLMAFSKTAGSIVQTLDFQGSNVNAASCKITCASISSALGSSADGTWLQWFPELRNVANLLFFNGGAPAVTITSPDGTSTYYTSGAWTSTEYTNWVVDGQVASWMLAPTSTPSNPVGGQTVKAKVTVRFAYTQQTQGPSGNYANGAVAQYHEKNITVTLTTLTTGTYYSNTQFQQGEPIPYGLAGYILTLESIPQYEGSILVQETEISDVCPLGSALNISGGLSAWASMAACVQSVRYSDNGQTEITFGPAKHLGPAQFVARLRSNIGPRWFNLIPANPLNQGNSGSAELGNNIPALAPTPGGTNFTFYQFLQNLVTQQNGSGGASTLPTGIHIDTGADTSFSGPNSFTQGSQIVIAAGGGSTGRFFRLASISGGDNGFTIAEAGLTGSKLIRLNMSDLGSSVAVYLQLLQTCEMVDGSPTTMQRYFLCSDAIAL